MRYSFDSVGAMQRVGGSGEGAGVGGVVVSVAGRGAMSNGAQFNMLQMINNNNNNNAAGAQNIGSQNSMVGQLRCYSFVASQRIV